MYSVVVHSVDTLFSGSATMISVPPHYVICELLLTLNVPRNLDCTHAQHVPLFDAAACQWLSMEQVRAQYPRFEGICHACKQQCRIYASLEHMTFGGWV